MAIVRINLGDQPANEGNLVAALEITDTGDIKLYVEENSAFGLRAVTEVMRLLVQNLDGMLDAHNIEIINIEQLSESPTDENIE